MTSINVQHTKGVNKVVATMNINYINRIIERLATSKVVLHFFENGQHVTYEGRKMASDIVNVGGLFRYYGLKPGSRVGIVGTNCYKWVILDLACLAFGLLSVGMDEGAGHDIEQLSQDCDLSIVLHVDVCEDLDRILKGGKDISNIDPRMNPFAFNDTDPIGLKFTSGSTGYPKAMALQSMSVSDTLENVQLMFNHTQGDRLLVFLPLYLYQQRFWIYSAILFDHEVIVVQYRHAIAAMQRLNPTVVMGVPEFFEGLVQNVDVGEEKSKRLLINLLGKNIRYLWSGSAPLSEDALKKYDKIGVPLYQGYGMNETCIVAKNYPGHNRLGSVGKIVTSKDVVLEDSGQILVRSKHPVADRYVNLTLEESREVFREDGLVATGDIGYVDESGYLYITGRIKDIIVLSSGKKIAPIPIEKYIECNPAIEKAVVFGNGKHYLTAVLVRRSSAIAESEIRNIVAQANQARPADERIVKYIISDEKMSPDNGLLTSQFKVRRNAVWKKYGNKLLELYDSRFGS